MTLSQVLAWFDHEPSAPDTSGAEVATHDLLAEAEVAFTLPQPTWNDYCAACYVERGWRTP